MSVQGRLSMRAVLLLTTAALVSLSSGATALVVWTGTSQVAGLLRSLAPLPVLAGPDRPVPSVVQLPNLPPRAGTPGPVVQPAASRDTGADVSRAVGPAAAAPTGPVAVRVVPRPFVPPRSGLLEPVGSESPRTPSTPVTEPGTPVTPTSPPPPSRPGKASKNEQGKKSTPGTTRKAQKDTGSGGRGGKA